MVECFVVVYCINLGCHSVTHSVRLFTRTPFAPVMDSFSSPRLGFGAESGSVLVSGSDIPISVPIRPVAIPIFNHIWKLVQSLC